MSKVELLAPAGDMACFKAAIAAGADAVYLGGEEYGARAYASNFSQDELCRAIQYAHLFHVKVYLTVNTLVKEREIDGICQFIAPFYAAGLDGVIVQDFGVLKLLKENFPNLLIHGSTQMCVTGKYGAELLKEQGVCRIVPARELSLKEIKEIKQETGIEVETFIHGAMCYAYSGQCLFSSFLGGRSGNRGRCAGPCRLPYTVFNQKEVYPLSLKDMCTLPILQELIEAGIDSFKIEGRMKNPYYVAGVTAIYRKYIDMYEQHQEKGTKYLVADADMEILKNLYVRTEMETGYYHRHNGSEMVTLQKPGYLTGDENEFEWIRKKYLDCEPKITLHCELKVRSREMLTLTVWNERGTTVLVSGTNPVAKALNRPISREDLQKQLAKTGNTPFHFETISVIMDEDVFIPLKEINELRRRALEEMIQTLSAVPGRTAFVPEPKTQLSLNGKNDVIKEKTFKIAVTTEEQWNSVISFYKEHMALRKQIAGLELHFSLLEKLHRNKHLMKQCMELELPLYLCLPQSGRKKGISYCDYFLNQELLKNFRGYYCGNPDTLGYIRMKLGQEEIPMEDVEILADYSLYTCNAQAVSFLKNCRITGLVGSYELNRHEWEELLCSCTGQNLRTEYLIYGHVPFMQSAGCVKKTFQQCDGKNTITYLTDRMGKRIPVMNFCQICENTVYNSVPLVLLEEMDDISCNDYRISFTVEDGKRTEAVLKSFMFREPLSISEFTKGHYKKGIE